MNSAGKLIMEPIIETKAITILRFFQGLHGDVYVTLEEGTWAALLYDLLKPHVTQVVVCNPRKNALLLKQGSKSDQIDARKLAELLCLGALSAVYHGGMACACRMRDYFTDHLPHLRGMSRHTIQSYRDSLVLLLRFLSARLNRHWRNST